MITTPSISNIMMKFEEPKDHTIRRPCSSIISSSSQHRRYFQRCRHRINNGGTVRFLLRPLIAFILASILSISHGIRVCLLEQCVPNCICDYQYDDMCALEYGNYGWNVPPTAGDYIWRHMKPETPISRAEIKPAGRPDESDRLTGLGYGNGKVLTITDAGIVGQVFFEVHPKHMESNEMIVELYGGIDQVLLGEVCGETGTLLGETKFGSTLPNDAGYSAKVIPYPSYNDNFFEAFMECHPRFTGAVMGAATFEIANPFAGGNFWFPQPPEQDSVGTLRYCVRVRVQPSGVPPNMPGTFIDTKFEIRGDRSGASFGDQSNVRIYSEQEWDSKKAHVARNSVEVEAFLCGLPPSANEVDHQAQATVLADGVIMSATPKSFGIGEEFNICVSLSGKAVNDYEVTGFQEVICENDGQSRTIVQKDGTPDVLTIIDRSTIGHIDLTEKAQSGTIRTIMEPGTVGIRSKVTTGWLQMDERKIECTGLAEVAKRKNPLNNRQLLRRDLQLAERQERGSVAAFSIYIDVNNSTSYNSDRSKNSGDCASCSKVFLTLAILLTLFGTLGGAGYWWWTTHGQDWLHRKRNDYNKCTGQVKLEEIAVSKDSDDHHRHRITRPFTDGTSSLEYDDFSDESRRWRPQ